MKEFTVLEIAKKLSVGSDAIQKYIQKKVLPATLKLVDTRHKYVIEAEDAKQFIKDHKAGKFRKGNRTNNPGRPRTHKKGGRDFTHVYVPCSAQEIQDMSEKGLTAQDRLEWLRIGAEIQTALDRAGLNHKQILTYLLRQFDPGNPGK